ncbi:uncharacterized protein QC761_104010 [Podospora bellae-mahoneyi]|uniref:Chromo domain-containing protein n=1 Tax=Podospora bellae-mahoneyi TaxID=2093777 RepID=A0ABR0FUW3_9PEZI|nr:hypothetical protein QC761_104010 [Podospora bellae-mahoneyi]
MPFVDNYMEDAPLQLIQSDLQESVEASYSRQSSVALDFAGGAGPTVVNLHEEEDLIINEQFNMPPALPEADMGLGASLFDDELAPSSSKKRGRPLRSSTGTSSETPAKSTPAAKTPRSTRSVGKSSATPKSARNSAGPKSASRSTGRKRKAEEIEETSPEAEAEVEATPAAKRGRAGRPARTAGKAASARLSLEAAKKPIRGRPKGPAAIAKPKNKGGRPKKDTSVNGVASEEVYEVEAIRDSGIDDKTKAHKFLVKWKGYPESENTWEPRSNLMGAEELVREFEKSQKKTKAADAAVKVSAPKKEKSEKPAAEKKAAPAKGRGKAKAVKKVAPAKKPVGRPGRRGRSAKA